MSEAGQIRELAPEFLRIAYEISLNEPSEIVRLDQIAEHISLADLGLEGREYTERLAAVAQYLHRRGFLDRQSDGYEMFTVTRQGMDEAERAAEEEHTSGRKQEPQRFLEAIYSLSDGNPSEFVYWQDVAAEMGWNPDNEEHHRHALAVAERLRQGRYVTIEVDEGDVYRITARGMDQIEGRTQLVAVPSISPPISPPPQIQDSLRNFQTEHTNPDKVAFIMMEFGQTPAHNRIVEGIKAGLGRYGIVGVRADERDYHDELFSNVLTYIYGCGLGIAVFDHIEANTHNPNVALEVGYLLAMEKPVCLLKDRTLPTLQADLVSRLYKEFDPQDPDETIPPVLSRWLSDRSLI